VEPVEEVEEENKLTKNVKKEILKKI